ncbi:envelope protein UL43 [Testudinid alphaherpesvirus 3]|uniref:Envelope protein UL43 n=1 Tax=Testudinid alphaherpesvirus 3 TaxID=2560801 RepID=A0A0K1R1C7_9ALPH|nr:envelope protein UL43 [Testudinid alphaherpesvirus 3]AIU39246.1 envelope protein UL43 [Testudinid alphaherpesvirus 3]AIU39356.1 envelope protein UL43 [Testudinid alphaherpesvirus 3]AKI81632.1 envelope protein UL43 [Testudinid alphaherpesvirus 3]AKI81736.1 envelope protein UL43 [Testudinid alphaherpesvirus 3]AKV40715.1 membrane protein [Testudinid alphaherpesvirus 3]
MSLLKSKYNPNCKEGHWCASCLTDYAWVLFWMMTYIALAITDQLYLAHTYLSTDIGTMCHFFTALLLLIIAWGIKVSYATIKKWTNLVMVCQLGLVIFMVLLKTLAVKSAYIHIPLHSLTSLGSLIIVIYFYKTCFTTNFVILVLFLALTTLSALLAHILITILPHGGSDSFFLTGIFVCGVLSYDRTKYMRHSCYFKKYRAETTKIFSDLGGKPLENTKKCIYKPTSHLSDENLAMEDSINQITVIMDNSSHLLMFIILEGSLLLTCLASLEYADSRNRNYVVPAVLGNALIFYFGCCGAIVYYYCWQHRQANIVRWVVFIISLIANVDMCIMAAYLPQYYFIELPMLLTAIFGLYTTLVIRKTVKDRVSYSQLCGCILLTVLYMNCMVYSVSYK